MDSVIAFKKFIDYILEKAELKKAKLFWKPFISYDPAVKEWDQWCEITGFYYNNRMYITSCKYFTSNK